MELELQIQERVEALRKGFIDKPKEVEGEPLEAILSMLEEIFQAIERPKHWSMPDKWGDFRRRIDGSPSPLELAARAQFEGMRDFKPTTLEEHRERTKEIEQRANRNNRYEVKR